MRLGGRLAISHVRRGGRGVVRVTLRRVVASLCRTEKALLPQSRAPVAYVVALRPVASDLQREAVLARLGEQNVAAGRFQSPAIMLWRRRE